jgi:hypothetical protein
MPAGAKPGERRGGRAKGAPNKRSVGELSYREQRDERARPHLDSLNEAREIAAVLKGMAAQEQREPKPDKKWIKELLEAAGRQYAHILPYDHRRLATLEPAMETVVKPDGSVHVTISRTDSEL